MSRPRIRVPGPLETEMSILLEGREAKRLLRVLRLGVGDSVSLFDGYGTEGQGRIIGASQGKVTLKVDGVWDAQGDSPLRVHLVQALPRWPKMELIAQKATELGVADIGMVVTKRSGVPSPGQGKRDRLLKIMEEAARQCGRGRVPALLGPWTLGGFLEFQGKFQGEKVLLWEGSKESGLEVLLAKASIADLWLVVGPEGGFDEQEVEIMVREGFLCVGLGPRILRTETASLAALAIVQFMFGDMRGKPSLGLD